MSESWREAMLGVFQDTMGRVGALLVKLLPTLTFLIIGLVVGLIIKAVLLRLLKAIRFDSLCDRSGLSAALARSGVRRQASTLVGRLAFWVIFLLFTFMAVDALNLQATANLMSGIIAFLPHLLAALLLLLAGWLLSNFIAEAALIGLVNAQVQEARLLANLIRWGILLFTFAMVLTQLGIAKEIVVAAFSIVFGGIVMALAIALGLGGRNIAREALERRLLQRRAKEEEGEEISHL